MENGEGWFMLDDDDHERWEMISWEWAMMVMLPILVVIFWCSAGCRSFFRDENVGLPSKIIQQLAGSTPQVQQFVNSLAFQAGMRCCSGFHKSEVIAQHNRENVHRLTSGGCAFRNSTVDLKIGSNLQP